ncbi:MAG: Mov34/MPN/PAD-1 family protein [Candidatus Electrothrix communis]|nr:MAG: Mov34/MPN/PAD-1 family protein [Candidatus Electrothrix communis]
MDDFWFQKAHQYIKEHRAFSNVGEISFAVDRQSATISAEIVVGLPARFTDTGVTKSGVRSVEPVTFRFQKEFPLKAPAILLREDFPRSFPHINPSQKEVLPCIYAGDLSELLQQSEWMNGILNQLVDWLEKAASGSLINYSQGWEPMRNDSPAGYITYDIYILLEFLKENNIHLKEIDYVERNGAIFVDPIASVMNGKKSILLVCQHPDKLIQKNYLPNSIFTLGDLYDFATKIGLKDLQITVEAVDSQYLKNDKIFVSLAIHRPCRLINSESNVEVLNFVITRSKPRKKKKRVLRDCPVGMLAHINETSTNLLKRFSGAKQTDDSLPITLLGCGSLGSKIGLHLARNGNGAFLCVDNDFFLPHNNARHGLSFVYFSNKADLLAQSISSISNQQSFVSNKTATETDFPQSRIIIDTTASLAVRSFLMRDKSLPPISSHGIYGGGKLGISLVEAGKKDVGLEELWAALYSHCLENKWLRNIIFSEQKENVPIGQGCGSHTVIMKDATLSLYASSMSLIVQNILENSLPEYGEIVLTRTQNDIDLVSERIEIKGSKPIPSITKRDWNVRVMDHVLEKMKEQAMVSGANETGGCLIGSVFLVPKSIIITDILPPPPDSILKPTIFVLGTEGLEQQIKNIERKTNGKITYLGTWHSHPQGGTASSIDHKTASRLLFVRNYEPTVCLIWTDKGIVQV